MKLLEMPEDSRPRERFQKLGPAALSDAELLAILLQKGSAKENAVELSNKLLSDYGIAKLPTLSLKELQQTSGIGPVKAIQIKAAFEFGRRASVLNSNNSVVRDTKSVYDYASSKIGGSDREQFLVLLLNSKNRIIKDEIVSIGILNASLVHPREIFKSAIRESANAIILVHNHPSGDSEPSSEDVFVTEQITKAGRLIGIKVLDHVIIGRNSHYSFAKEGRL